MSNATAQQEPRPPQSAYHSEPRAGCTCHWRVALRRDHDGGRNRVRPSNVGGNHWRVALRRDHDGGRNRVRPSNVGG
ncbi:MAG: hypothetical protein RMM08_13910, partial [Armatimonadota bacterium]|nr:hypothetical protein [Armatimonadota bacterium]